MSSATPLWVPLVVAVVGVGGTLSASVVTQVLTRRRDEQRWSIERDERTEQWRREDAARWLADRRAAYADLLTALHEQHALLLRGLRLTAEGRRPDAAATARLESLRETLQRARHAAGLLASPAVARSAGALADVLARHTDRVLDGGAGDDGADLDGFAEALDRLGADMRDDLAGPGTPSGPLPARR
jgi:hypothetical protein